MSKERTPEQKAAHREYMKKHREKNKDKYLSMEKARRDARTPEQRDRDLAYAKKYYDENKDKMNEMGREWWHTKSKDPEFTRQQRERTRNGQRKLTSEIIQHYGGKCACCGESIQSMLVIDHIHNDGGQHRREIATTGKPAKGGNMYSWIKRNNFPDGMFQVLCWNCNMSKHRNGGTCEHQAAKFSELSKSDHSSSVTPED